MRLRSSLRTAALGTAVLLSALLGAGANAAPASADTPGHLFDVYSVAVSPDGQRVYAGQGLGAAYVALGRDASTSHLTYLANPIFPEPNSGAGGEFRRTIAVAPDSATVYDSLNGSNALRLMSRSDASLTFRQELPNYTAGISGMTGPQVLAVAPTGNCLYVTAQNQRLLAFSIGSADALTFVNSDAASGGGLDMVVASPDGKFLYSNGGGSGLDLWTADPTTCSVAHAGSAGTAPSNTGPLAISPDGKFVFDGDGFNNVVRSYSRDATTGALSLVGALTQGVAGVDGLDGLQDIAVSPDGNQLYAVAANENSLSTFGVSADGHLTFDSLIRNGQPADIGLARPSTVVVAPDGASVYVGTPGTSAGIVAFSRAADGGLQFEQHVTEADGPGYVAPGGPGGPGGGSDGPPPTCTTAAPPPGPVGVSINNGAQYTNDPDVHVAVVWPACVHTLTISNDGGFRAAEVKALARTTDWTLSSSGPERLPKTIYVRFDGSTQTFQDDIILDETAPRILGVSTSGAATSSASIARARLLHIRAKDNASGVKRIQFARSKKHPGKRVRFRSRMAAPRASTLYVRVQDGAGNNSRWKRVRIG